jgi:hypothetical protein
MKRRIAGIALLGVLICFGLSQTPPSTDPGPVQAELLANMHVRRLASGKAVFARVTQDWMGPDCMLRKGAVLEGTVEEAAPRVGKSESKIALSFKQAQCNGWEMRPMDLVLTVIARAPDNWDSAPNTQNTMTMQIPAGLVSGQSMAMGSFKMTQQTLTQLQMSGIDHRFPARKNILPGDVLDLKGLALGIGTGPNRSTVISSKVRDVFLAEYTQILLAPPALAFRASPVRLVTTGLAQPHAGDASMGLAAPVPPPPNDIEICAPPGCAVDLPVSAQELEGHTASAIATHPLGYMPRTNKVLGSFADEESLVWLGPGQLLFSFNPHRLIRRGKAEQGRTARLIRAVLLDTATRNVVRAVDWEINDSRRYLWQLDGDRLLVHVGNELRVYGSGLEVQRSVPLAGPLMFVRLAPGGGLMAVATLRERHSPELHAKLRNEVGTEPEEDVDVAILNQDFNTVAQVSTVSNLMPPTLLNEGQVRLQSEPGQWYRLALSTWENKRSALARFRSFCTPELTSTAPDLLFLLTCNAQDGNTEYSVLRPDGKVLLRGVSNPQEVGHEATGNHLSRRFAVKIVHAERSIFSSTNFKSSELDSEEVRVYRAEDGKRLLAVRVKEPIASHGGYALSPDGSQLAVLSGADILFYPVPAN